MGQRRLARRISATLLSLSLIIGCGERVVKTYFEDITGDGKKDFIYRVYTSSGGCGCGERVEIRYRENLGDGKFGEERVLSSTENMPREIISK